MSNHTIREGFSSYYVIKRGENHGYEERIIEERQCRMILPMTIRQVDDEAYYYYKTSGYSSLEKCFLRKKYTIEDYEKLYEMIFQTVEELEEYLLPAEGILLESEALFYDEDQQILRCCYDPSRESDLMEQLQQLTEEWLESMNYEDRSLVEYLYGVHGQLVKGILPGRKEKKEIETEQVIEKIEIDSTIPEEVLEIEDSWEMPKKANKKVRRTKTWYSEIAFAVVTTLICTFFLGYQVIEILQYGWQLQKGKYLLIAVVLFIANICYLLHKYRHNIKDEEVTMILTDDTTVDKMGR